MSARLTTEQFVTRAREVHGDRFGYELVTYAGMHTKVIIVCPDHGKFEQTPVGHLAGYGCSVCSGKKPYTTETFAEAGRRIHEGRYTYELVDYVSNKKLVWIACPEHGPWQQLPMAHLKGHGCAACAGSKQHTTGSFVEAARSVHGDEYGYELVEYGSSNKDKVTIVCREHGPFEQSPNAHMRGNRCPQCSPSLPMTRESFIARATEVHGDRFDYSLVATPRNSGKVTIICPLHGPFQQGPSSHLQGVGCAACAGVKAHTQESFLAAAREVHGDRFGYEKAIYRGNKVPLTITCPEHGDFQQKPNSHLSGGGCAACSGKKQLDTEAFVQRARALHGDYFDYSEVEYIHRKAKVTIVCPSHGGFEQSPNDHLSGRGCRRCKTSFPERQIAALLEREGVGFLQQFSHRTLRYVHPLRLDFFIPEYRTIIEYDGPHHREPSFWRYDSEEEAIRDFRRVQQRDIAKELWAKSNRLLLIRLTNPKTIEEDLRAEGILK